tara:strand:+ start:320 stop:505 length:186 start_codon:yes stop_codon:yes gene_type:complete
MDGINGNSKLFLKIIERINALAKNTSEWATLGVDISNLDLNILKFENIKNIEIKRNNSTNT